MKLHLPKGLLVAVLAVVSASSSWAGYEWTGNTENPSSSYTAEDWTKSDYWNLTDGSTWNTGGTGPGTPNSNMWDAVTIKGNGTENSLTIGSAGSRIKLEGWTPKYEIKDGATLYAHFKKFQGTPKWLEITNGSTLDAQLGGNDFTGNDGDSITVDVGDDSDFILRLGRDASSSMILVLDNTASFSLLSTSDTTRTLGNLTVKSELDVVANKMVTKQILTKTGVDITNFAFEVNGVLGDAYRRSSEAITAENYTQHYGEYYVNADNTVTYVGIEGCMYSSASDFTWTDGAAMDDNATFASGNNMVFANTSTITATVDERITAGDVYVGDDSTVVLSGKGSLKANSLNLVGSASFSLNTANNEIATVKADDASTLIVANGVEQGYDDLHIASGKNKFNLVISGEGTIVTTNSTGNAAFHQGNVMIRDNGILELTNYDGLGYNNGGALPKISIENATLALGGRTTFQTDIEMLGGAIITNGSYKAGNSTASSNNVPIIQVHSYNSDVLNWTVSGKDNKVTDSIKIYVNNPLNINVQEEGELTIAAAFSNSGSFTKSGSGKLVLESSIDYTGTTTVSGGELVLQAASNIGKGAISVAKNAVLTVDTCANQTIGSVITGDGQLALNGKLTVNAADLRSWWINGDSVEFSDGENGYSVKGVMLANVGEVLVGANAGVDLISGSQTTTLSASDLVSSNGNLFASTDLAKQYYYVNTKVTYDAATMANMQRFLVASGAKLYTSDTSILSKTSAQDATATVYLDSPGGTITANALSGFNNNIVITSGTTVNAGANDCFGEFYTNTNTARSITLESGAVFDFKGKDPHYKFILKEGSTLRNTGENRIPSSHMQAVYISLAGGATVDAQYNFGLRYGNDKATSERLDLNGHTLIKTGAGEFFLYNTTVNAGTIDIRQGALVVHNGTGYENVDLKMAAGTRQEFKGGQGTKSWKSLETSGNATLQVGANTNLNIANGTTAAGKLTKTDGGSLQFSGATVLSGGVNVSAGAVTLNGATTLGGTISVANEATLNVTNEASVTIDLLAGFIPDNKIPTTNGLISSNSFKIVDNKGTSNLTSVIYKEEEKTLTDGLLTFSENINIFYAVEAGADKVVTVGGDSATAGTTGATEFYVGENGTLRVSGLASDKAAKDILRTISGNGTVEVACTSGNDWSTTLDSSTGFTGTTYVTAGKFTLNGSSYGNTLKLADGVNMQITGSTTFNKILTLEDGEHGHELHTNGTQVLTLTGTVNGTGSLKKLGGGTLKVMNGASVARLITANGTTSVEGGTVANLQSTGGTTSISGGTVSDLQVSGGTASISGGTVANLQSTGGVTTVTANGIIIGKAGETFDSTHSTGIYVKDSGTVNIGNGSTSNVVTTTRIEMGDTSWVNGQDGNLANTSSSLNIKSGATLVVTGGDIAPAGNATNYHTTGFLIGEWGEKSIVNIEGQLLAKNASVAIGDATGVVNVKDGGLLATKGLKEQREMTYTALELNVESGGTLILGSTGISGFEKLTATFGAGEIGITEDSSIANNISLNSADGTTFNTTKYVWGNNGASIAEGTEGGTIVISGSVSGTGHLIKEGAGTLKLNGANTYSGGTTISAGTLETGHSSALGTDKVTVNGGILQMAADLSVSAMDYLAGSVQTQGHTLSVTGTLKVGNSQSLEAPTEGGVNVGTLELQDGASATMGAGLTVSNLTMASGSTITIDDTVQLGGGTSQAQTLLTGDSTSTGYTLSLEKGLTLQGNILGEIGKLAPGSGEVVIFSGVDTLKLGNETYNVGADVLDAGSGVKLNDYFQHDSIDDQYYLGFNANGDVYAGRLVPEPATATLSLLALAGLCARRRRK